MYFMVLDWNWEYQWEPFTFNIDKLIDAEKGTHISICEYARKDLEKTISRAMSTFRAPKLFCKYHFPLKGTRVS
jgi:hypothetical protein